MATKQNKINDPELAAFSAVEDALTADLSEVLADAVSSAKDVKAAAEPERPVAVIVEPDMEAEQHLPSFLDDPNLADMPEQPAFVAPDRAAVANDDRRNAGIFMQTLQRRPSRAAYVWASALSLVWLGALGGFAWSQGLMDTAALTASASPFQLFLGGCALMLPIIAFFVTAIMSVRAQEIRLASRAIGEAAIHLAQPESLTTDAVLTVSQTIRREVAAIGDGVERAIARAGELEALVRSEISTLERAYFDNEVRIHSLVDELNVQREAIIANADRVRSAMSGSHENMVIDMEQLAQRVADTMNSAGERVTNLLDARGLDIHRGITDAGNQLTASLESKVGDIATVFERTGNVLTQHLHEGASSVTRTLAQTGKEVIDTLNTQGATVKKALENTADTLELSFITRGKEVTDRLAQTGEEVSQTIASQGTNVRNILEETAGALEQNFVKRGHEVSEKLMETGGIVAGNIGTSITQLHEVVSQATATIGKEVTGNSARLSEELISAGNRLVGDIIARGGDVRERISIVGSQVAEEISSRGKEIYERLEGTVQLANDTIGTRVETLAERIDSASQRVSDSVMTQGQTLEKNLMTLGDRVSTLVGSQVNDLKNTFEVQGRDFAETLQKHSEEAKTNLSSTGRDVLSAMAGQGTRINETLRVTAESLASVVEERGKEVHEALASRLTDFDTVITRGVEAVTHISGEVNSLTSVISGSLGEMDNLLINQGNTLISSLSDRTQEISTLFASQISQMEEQSTRRSTEITGNFDMLVMRVDQTLSARSNAISEALVARTAEMAKSMAESGRNVAQTLEASAEELGRSVTAKSTLLAETLSSAAEELNGVLGNRATEIAHTLDSRVTDIENRVVNRLESVTHALEDKGRAASGMLGSRIAELADLFDVRGTSLVDNLGVRLGQMSALVDNSGAQFMESLNTRIADIDRLFDSSSSSLMTSLGNRIGEIGDVFDVSGENMLSKLNSRFAEIDHAFSARSTDILGTIHHQLGGVGEMLSVKGNEITNAVMNASTSIETALNEGANSAITSLTNTNSVVRNEIIDVLKSLEAATGMLRHISTSAGENLGTVGETLDKRIHEIEEVLGAVTQRTEQASGQLARNVNALQQVSSAAMGHADTLAATTANLENVGTRLGAALSERHQQLGGLVEAVNARSSDIEAIAEHFTKTISASLQHMEQQYARLRSSSDVQGQRIAEGMMGAYQAAAGEMNQTMSSAATQFRDSMSELRSMTGQIRKELDETRAELRKGAVELPQETQETAANMRRVVADQIKALNELSSLVTRSNRALDTEVEQKHQVRAAAAPGLAEAVRSTPISAHFPEKAVIQPQVTSVAQVAASMHTPRPVVPEQTVTPVPPAPPAAPAGSKGWLSDLLNRASRDEGHAQPGMASPAHERSRHNSLESLDSISVDIARMIDHTAAVELWDRYKRGERNVFTRRLYTLQGQQTFEDIRRKYASDQEFHQTVDRYIAEFERLLSEVAQNDRDSLLTNTYLTSETGKVYTMLAHAAGRLQ